MHTMAASPYFSEVTYVPVNLHFADPVSFSLELPDFWGTARHGVLPELLALASSMIIYQERYHWAVTGYL